MGAKFKYENRIIDFVVPESRHKYIPDFSDTKGNWIVEAKGKFDINDRKKHRLLREQYPDLKIIIVFQNANQRIRKNSKTTYGQWCTKNDIQWVHRTIPKDLLR